MNEEAKERKTIEISLGKALATVGGAVLVTAVGTFFAAVAALNSDHFSLAALADRVTLNEQTDKDDHATFITRVELTSLVIDRLDRIEAKLDRLVEETR